MFYRKNLPTGQRIARILGALLLATCAVHYGKNAVGITFAVAALIAVGTALVGYCPICQITGVGETAPDRGSM